MPDSLPVSQPQPPRDREHSGAFLTTRWSRVVKAGDSPDKDSQSAMEGLCRDYWRPLYYFARRSGHSPEDAEDLTQGFIMGLLQSGSIARATPERGRFRSFLVGAFGHYRANWRREQGRQKRGGGAVIFSIDTQQTEAAFALEASDAVTPESLYERSWALALLDKAMGRLREEYAEANRTALFAAVEPHLSGAGPRPGYAKMAEELGLSENAITMAVHRMRKRFAALLREEIAATVTDEAEVEDELRYLIRILAG